MILQQFPSSLLLERSFRSDTLLVSMGSQHKRDQWLQDIQARQRNYVFPDTVQNEARFWRNLKDIPWSTSTKIGMAILAIFVGGFGVRLLVALIQEHRVLPLALAMILVWGPIFGGIAWVTKRALRKIEKDRRDPANSKALTVTAPARSPRSRISTKSARRARRGRGSGASGC